MSDKYDPKYFCISDEESPLALSSDGDPKKCELWVSIDKLEKRKLHITSLHSKSMYKSFISVEQKI